METITEKQNNVAKNSNQDFAYVEAMLNDGTPVKISKSVLTNIFSEEINKQATQNNVFVVYHKRSNNFANLASPEDWPIIERQGEKAEGVAIFGGDRHLVIALNDAPEILSWSTTPIVGGGFSTTDRMAAMNDWAGKASTDKQYLKQQCQPQSTAVGYCKNYQMANENGNGLTAGMWWLPSAAELFFICANKIKINYALSKIKGAEKLKTEPYLSSTEYSETVVWTLTFASFYFGGWLKKDTGKGWVRPVTYFNL